MLTYFLKGMGLSAGLIMAIGSQNAHVLRMGLRRQHVALTVITCIACEVMLIIAGIAGIGDAIGRHPSGLLLAKWGGALFLCWYGVRSWRAAWTHQSLQPQALPISDGAMRALLAILAVTLLNPHVYLDTVILLGAVGAQQPGDGRWWFALGAIANASIWYLALGYGARLLAPWFAKPVAWRILDGGIAIMMWLLAAGLLLN